jgi:hypothetical protein
MHGVAIIVKELAKRFLDTAAYVEGCDGSQLAPIFCLELQTIATCNTYKYGSYIDGVQVMVVGSIFQVT